MTLISTFALLHMNMCFGGVALKGSLKGGAGFFSVGYKILLSLASFSNVSSPSFKSTK